MNLHSQSNESLAEMKIKSFWKTRNVFKLHKKDHLISKVESSFPFSTDQ